MKTKGMGEDTAPSSTAVAILLPPLKMHPRDVALLEVAASIAGYSIGEFAKLAIYRTSVSVVQGSDSIVGSARRNADLVCVDDGAVLAHKYRNR